MADIGDPKKGYLHQVPADGEEQVGDGRARHLPDARHLVGRRATATPAHATAAAPTA
jgi:hypothetical protein